MKFEKPIMTIARFDDIKCDPTVVSNANLAANDAADTSVSAHSASGARAANLTITF